MERRPRAPAPSSSIRGCGTILNSGTIAANLNGTTGTASAIVDKSGSVSLVQNSGAIGVANAAALGDSAVAIDLSANTSGASAQQVAAASGKPAPMIAGTLLFGSGNDILDVSAGTVKGAARFGAGNNQVLLSGDAAMTGAVQFGTGADSVQLGGTSVLTGSIDFGGGADILALSGTSAFHGTLANSSAATATVGAGSTLGLSGTGAANLASLTTGAGATLGVSIGQGTSSLFNISGIADFGAGTKVQANLLKLGDVAGTYQTQKTRPPH